MISCPPLAIVLTPLVVAGSISLVEARELQCRLFGQEIPHDTGQLIEQLEEIIGRRLA